MMSVLYLFLFMLLCIPDSLEHGFGELPLPCAGGFEVHLVDVKGSIWHTVDSLRCLGSRPRWCAVDAEL